MRANGAGRDIERRAAARRVGTWRRLFLIRGPQRCWRCAMLVAEMARPKQKCMVACPTHKVLAEQMHVSTRSVERQFAALVETGWLERVGPRAQRGTAQSYQLRVPNSITPELAELAHSLAPGMWQRLKNYPQPDTP